MGTYINTEEPKEVWLTNNALPLSDEMFFAAKYEPTLEQGLMLVVLVYNSSFTAAAVMDSERELKYWQETPDGRVKLYFTVSVEKLKKIGVI